MCSVLQNRNGKARGEEANGVLGEEGEEGEET